MAGVDLVVVGQGEQVVADVAELLLVGFRCRRAADRSREQRVARKYDAWENQAKCHGRVAGGVNDVAFEIANRDRVAVIYDFIDRNSTGIGRARDGVRMEFVDGILNSIGMVMVIVRNEEFFDRQTVLFDIRRDAPVPFTQIDDHDFFCFGASEEESVHLDGVQSEMFQNHSMIPSRFAFSKFA